MWNALSKDLRNTKKIQELLRHSTSHVKFINLFVLLSGLLVIIVDILLQCVFVL